MFFKFIYLYIRNCKSQSSCA